jgi:hypothetical protein
MSSAETLPTPIELGSRHTSARAEELIKNCTEIAAAPAGNTHAIASVLQKMIVFYYEDVRKQAMLSFWSAIAAAVAGILVLLYAIGHTMSSGISEKSVIALVASVLAQFISGVSFYLYFKAARQFASFHICLERTNRYLLANTIAEGLQDPARSEVKRALVKTIASAPMLTVEAVTGKT